MSTSIHDIIETEKMSNCCGSSMYELGDNYLCRDCGDHCEAVSEEECPLEGRMGQCKEGECFHGKDRAFSNDQLAQIAKKEKECDLAGCEGNEHKCV